jgi:hypothetical protein
MASWIAGGAGVGFGFGEGGVGVEDVAAGGFAVGGQPEPVLACGDLAGVGGDDVVQGGVVLGGFDGGGVVDEFVVVPQVDVDEGGVEVVAVVGALDGVGAQGGGEGLA